MCPGSLDGKGDKSREENDEAFAACSSPRSSLLASLFKSFGYTTWPLILAESQLKVGVRDASKLHRILKGSIMDYYDALEVLVLLVFLFVITLAWKIHSDNKHALKGLTKLPGASKR